MLLSIIMCNHNYGEYLRYALEGIVTQTVLPSEFIFIDDASTDHSLQILEEYIKKYPWIQLHKNKERKGAYKSAQYGLEIAQGKYVYFACSDDRILKGFVENSLKTIEMFPEAGLVCSTSKYFQNETEIDLNLLESEPIKTPIFFSRHEILDLKKKNFPIAGQTALYHREKVMEAGGVIESIEFLCDWFFSHVIAFRYGIVYIPNCLAIKRLHMKNLSNQNFKEVPFHGNLFNLLEKEEFADIKHLFYKWPTLNENRIQFIRALSSKKGFRWLKLQLKMMERFKGIFQKAPFIKKIIRKILINESINYSN